jgi:uncharacterized protein (TIRG00374 family)
MQEISSSITSNVHPDAPAISNPPHAAPAGDASANNVGLNWVGLLRNHRLRWVWSLVSLGLLLAAGVLLLRNLSLSEITAALATANPAWVLVTVVVLTGGQALRIARGRRILGWENTPPRQPVAQAILGAQVINWLSPIRIGDLWRIWRVHEAGRNSWLWSASTVLIEKSLDSLVLAAFALLLAIGPLPEGSIPSSFVRLGATAFAGLLIVSGSVALRPDRWQSRLFARFPQLKSWIAQTTRIPSSASSSATSAAADATSSAGFRIEIRNARQWLTAISLSAGVWGLAVCVNLTLAQALGIQIGPWTLVMLVVALQTGAVLSAIPGNIGVIPLITYGVLTLAGVDPALALAHGTLHYVLAYGVNALLFGLTFAPFVQRPQRHELA